MATVFTVRASPGKGSFSVSLASDTPLVLRVGIMAAPEKGEANRELVFQLERMLGCTVQLLSGQTGRKKALAANCSQEQLVAKVKEFKENEKNER
ncbi:MAG: DUF167 domain-containing protein [Candidatus Micrarchaeota archaeon]|nr:DUF167 domain-containing protein [Candidatus Micrarchaeota archaeon]